MNNTPNPSVPQIKIVNAFATELRRLADIIDSGIQIDAVVVSGQGGAFGFLASEKMANPYMVLAILEVAKLKIYEATQQPEQSRIAIPR